MTTDTTIPPHPAKFSPNIITELERFIVGYVPDDSVIVDPFAGPGGIHQIVDRVNDTQVMGLWSIGVEIEPEWARADPRTITGDSRRLADIIEPPDERPLVVITSPAYGNRMADQYAGDAKGSTRHTYRVKLGRELDPNSGARLHFGLDYQLLHRRVWKQCAKLEPEFMVVNVKNFIRRDEIVDVVGWHRETLGKVGFDVTREITVPVTGNRHGANGDLRVDHEIILVARMA